VIKERRSWDKVVRRIVSIEKARRIPKYKLRTKIREGLLLFKSLFATLKKFESISSLTAYCTKSLTTFSLSPTPQPTSKTDILLVKLIKK
jgi:hypothetical protein